MASVDQGFAVFSVAIEKKITPASPQPDAENGGAPPAAHGWYGEPFFGDRQPGLDLPAIVIDTSQALPAGSSDTTPPVVAFVTSSPIAQGASIVVDITDDSGNIGVVAISAIQGSAVETILDGNSLVGPYTNSSASPITDGFRVTIVRDGGWISSSVTIDIVATDPSGNETITSKTYAVTGVAPITVGNYVPTQGTPIEPTQPIQFDVTDSTFPFRAIIVTVGFPTGDQDVIFNGKSFVGKYILSSRSAISNGFRYVVQRIGGWPYGPTIQAYAFDRGGNEAT